MRRDLFGSARDHEAFERRRLAGLELKRGVETADDVEVQADLLPRPLLREIPSSSTTVTAPTTMRTSVVPDPAAHQRDHVGIGGAADLDLVRYFAGERGQARAPGAEHERHRGAWRPVVGGDRCPPRG